MDLSPLLMLNPFSKFNMAIKTLVFDRFQDVDKNCFNLPSSSKKNLAQNSSSEARFYTFSVICHVDLYISAQTLLSISSPSVLIYFRSESSSLCWSLIDVEYIDTHLSYPLNQTNPNGVFGLLSFRLHITSSTPPPPMSPPPPPPPPFRPLLISNTLFVGIFVGSIKK